jgi:hypothetical protein
MKTRKIRVKKPKKTKKIRDILYKNKKINQSLKTSKKFIEKYTNSYDTTVYEDVLKLDNKHLTKKEMNIYKKYNDLSNDKKLKPYNDYYNWVVKSWIQNIIDGKLNKNTYFDKYDYFRITQDKTYSDLYLEFTNFINEKNKKDPTSKYTKNLNSFITSILKYGVETYDGEHIILNHIIKTKNSIEKFIEQDDLYGLLAYLNRNEMIKIEYRIEAYISIFKCDYIFI